MIRIRRISWAGQPEWAVCNDAPLLMVCHPKLVTAIAAYRDFMRQLKVLHGTARENIATPPEFRDLLLSIVTCPG